MNNIETALHDYVVPVWLALERHVRAAPVWMQALVALMLLSVVYNFVRGLFPKNVKGKVVLITGAGSGIGQLTAVRFAKLGSKLVLWDINETGLKTTEEMLKPFGTKTVLQKVNVTQSDEVYKAVEAAKQQLGPIDIVINNAGIVSGDVLPNLKEDAIHRTFAVNVISHFYILKKVLPDMIKANSGHVCTIASMAGLQGTAKMTDYCASKYAAVGLHDSLRSELARQGATGVKCTLICPFYINTGMFAGARSRFSFLLPILEPSYVADNIVAAIRLNKERVLMPRLCSLVPLLRAVLPTSVQDVAMSLLGINSSMDHFTGRKAD